MITVVVGAGAAGLMCAANIKNSKIIVLERNEKVGKKLFISGKGRCNITNDCDVPEFLDNVVNNAKFLMSSIYEFTPNDCISYFNQSGLKTKTERGNRVFPFSDKSSDVIKILFNNALNNGAEFIYNSYVKDIKYLNNKFYVFYNGNKIECDNVVLACGGTSYQSTGSDGNGYRLSQNLGHKITNIRAGLVPINFVDDVSSLMGLSLKNVMVSIKINNKTFTQFGEMLFTKHGVSGPIILSLSSYINSYNIKNAVLSVDLKPALTIEKLDARVLLDFKKYSNKQFKNSLNDLLPKSLIPFFIKRTNIDEDKPVNLITAQERQRVVNTLKKLDFKVDSLMDINAAIITSGGVDIKDVNPKTMESKIIKGLYFAGELLDVDALTGGFNIHIALATANKIARNII